MWMAANWNPDSLKHRMAKISLGATIHFIWPERNKRVFANESNNHQVIIKKKSKQLSETEPRNLGRSNIRMEMRRSCRIGACHIASLQGEIEESCRLVGCFSNMCACLVVGVWGGGSLAVLGASWLCFRGFHAHVKLADVVFKILIQGLNGSLFLHSGCGTVSSGALSVLFWTSRLVSFYGLAVALIWNLGCRVAF